MDEINKENLIKIIEDSIKFKNINSAILSVTSKDEDKEVIITDESKIKEFTFPRGDIIKIALYFIDKEDREREFKVV
ncbi:MULTISPECIES: hypothetical protein [Bacteria]|uniref:hypothetical protein n=1 Tax=Bacteria TaxID=2 RepID=UPI002E7B2829|nr:hypothetical protein [Cetobacterium somerae]WVJ03075.1 hypothetical protein VSU16_15195 [Cetobacterium somerae]